MLHLEKVTVENLSCIRAGLVEIAQNPTPFDIRAVQKMIEAMDTDFDGYLDSLKQGESDNQPEGRVPDTVLLLFDDDDFIGVYDVRHRLIPALMQQGGHIAYHIVPSARCKGYVKAGLKLVLEWCSQNLGLERVLLFCKKENMASDRAMSSVMAEMGGSRVPDKELNGHIERGVWIKTRKTSE